VNDEHIGLGTEKIFWHQTHPPCSLTSPDQQHGRRPSVGGTGHKEIHLCGDLLLGLNFEVLDEDLKIAVKGGSQEQT
jgi:hypothetical protein